MGGSGRPPSPPGGVLLRGAPRQSRGAPRPPDAFAGSASGFRPGAVLLAGAVLAGCALRPVEQPAVQAPPPARQDFYVVLPDREGRTGALVITHGAEQRILDAPYVAARIPAPGRLEIGRTTEEEVRVHFGPVLDTLPPAPATFRLHFTFGTDELTPESRQALGQVSAEIARRPAPEVVVVGHTDRVGTVESNDALSRQRAERVRGELIAVGIPAESIQTAGRGEREPLVATDDEVAEPRNRRVEVTVR
jgi:outer membrane protein OmpA-like peptidoglycan-associated protein